MHKLPSSPGRANFEYILTGAEETFLWRKDNYPWERNVWNFHPEIEIHYVTNASGISMVGDHIGEFRPGEIAIVGSNLPHDWVTQTKPGEIIEGRDIVIQFHPDKIAQASKFLPELAAITDYLELSKRGLSLVGETRNRAEAMILSMEHQSGAARLVTLLELLAMLQTSQEHVVLSSQFFTPDLQVGNIDTLQAAFAYIFANIAEDIRMADVAQLADMSESSFSRFFKKNSGLSFTDYVSRLRLSKAAQMLSDGDGLITDICYESGFRNLSNFNRTFLRHHGLTPSKYRQLVRKRRITPVV